MPAPNIDLSRLSAAVNPTAPSDGAPISGNIKRDRRLMYWKRCVGVFESGEMCPTHTGDFGYIIHGPHPNQFTIPETWDFKTSKHATEMDPRYVAPAPGALVHPSDELTNHESRWNPLIRNNGLHEMPIQQMISFGWHRLKPFQEAFPELKTIQDIPCEYGCVLVGPRARLFTTREAYAAHVSVMHKDVQAPKAMADAVREAVTLVGSQKTYDPEMLAALISAVMENLKGK